MGERGILRRELAFGLGVMPWPPVHMGFQRLNPVHLDSGTIFNLGPANFSGFFIHVDCLGPLRGLLRLRTWRVHLV